MIKFKQVDAMNCEVFGVDDNDSDNQEYYYICTLSWSYASGEFVIKYMDLDSYHWYLNADEMAKILRKLRFLNRKRKR